MYETVMSFLTPKTREQPKEWWLKGSPAMMKPKFQEMRKKQVVFVFFDCKGAINMHYGDIGAQINSSYIISILAAFMMAIKKKHMDLVALFNWMLHWDNAHVHKAKVATKFLPKRGVRMPPHPPYSPDLAPTDYYFFPIVKTKPGASTLSRTGSGPCGNWPFGPLAQWSL